MPNLVNLQPMAGVSRLGNLPHINVRLADAEAGSSSFGRVMPSQHASLGDLQAVEVLQAVGDHPELGASLQIPPPSSPPMPRSDVWLSAAIVVVLQIGVLVLRSMRPTPLQKRLAAMMEGLRDDKAPLPNERFAVPEAQSSASGLDVDRHSGSRSSRGS